MIDRRQAGSGQMRRGGRAPSSVADNTIANLLGSNLIEQWDARFGIVPSGSNVSSWIGRRLGLTVTAVTAAPTYSQNAALGNKFTVNSIRAENRCLGFASDHGSTIVASGTRPYLAWVGSVNAYGTSGREIFNIGISGGSPRLELYLPDATNIAGRWNVDVNQSAIYATTDTDPHMFEVVQEADNQLVLYRDGTEVARDATASVLGSNLVRVGIGGRPSGDANFVDASHALALICVTAPSAGERADLLAYVQQTWGTP